MQCDWPVHWGTGSVVPQQSLTISRTPCLGRQTPCSVDEEICKNQMFLFRLNLERRICHEYVTRLFIVASFLFNTQNICWFNDKLTYRFLNFSGFFLIPMVVIRIHVTFGKSPHVIFNLFNIRTFLICTIYQICFIVI